MVLRLSNTVRFGISTLALSAALSAAPRLLLSPQTAYIASIPQGSNGNPITVDAANKGDGSLSLSVASSVPWLVPTLGSARPCAFTTCIPVQIALQTSALAKGTYTGFVAVRDPNAIDAPQTISVTVQIGGAVPDSLEFFAPPNGSDSRTFVAGGSPKAAVTAGNNFLSISAPGAGSFAFNVPYTVTASATTLGAGDYQGSIALTNSSFGLDNKTIGVTLHVTTQPIASIGPASLSFRIAQGAAKQTAGVGVANSGLGTLTVSGVATSTASGGSFLSAQTISGGVSVTADPSGLSPGVYQGTVTVASNAANSSVAIPVTLTVLAAGPPVASAGGVVNNGNFGSNESLAQGDIVAVFGDQFTAGDPQQAGSLPLPTSLGGSQVFVNNQPVPVYYVSAGQINFQIPYDAAIGDGTVRIDNNGQRGNSVFVNIKAREPRLLSLGGGPYAILTTPTNALTGIPSNPVKAGDTVVIYMIGLGPTSPPVNSGEASPTNPLATVPGGAKVCFGGGGFGGTPLCTDAQFAGLTPGFVGLYQVNVAIPVGAPTGLTVPFYIQLTDTTSNTVQIAVQ